ncbi:MAG: hypothetical protein PHH67_03180 [Methanosarcina sp.]|nr:hypothetical protein [Methanosarcina sp.]
MIIRLNIHVFGEAMKYRKKLTIIMGGNHDQLKQDNETVKYS